MKSLYASPTFGNAGGMREFISYEARAVLVEKVLTCATAGETRKALAEIGVIRRNTAVGDWMRLTRVWLGLPPLYPSAISYRYKEAVEAWIEENGFPSREEILEGWLPGKKVRSEKSK
ncbi:MAG: hypothetical protein QM627_07865 [Luteolibacter sp.]